MMTMALAAAHSYFAHHLPGYARCSPDDLPPIFVMEIFTAPAGWQWSHQPKLTAELVDELDAGGVRAIAVYTCGRRAEFEIVPAGPMSPAYLE